jgi:hypothetical protein
VLQQLLQVLAAALVLWVAAECVLPGYLPSWAGLVPYLRVLLFLGLVAGALQVVRTQVGPLRQAHRPAAPGRRGGR